VKNRKMGIAAVLALINLPVALVLIEAVWYYTSNRSNGSFMSSGQSREYLLHVPSTYDPAKPTPLVISMHGAGLWGAAQKETSQWNDLADKQRFIVVYPSGARGNGPRIWHVEPSAGLMTDVRFISQLIDTLAASYNIDRSRIYANGVSNGGGMAFVLSCALSDRIAAVGMVAAAQTLPWEWCTDRRAVPMIAFHGTHDPIIPYNGGRAWISSRAFPNVPKWTANWAARNRCAAQPVDSVVAEDVTRRAYTSCADGATVMLYTVQGGGHTWPGGKPLPEWLAGTTSYSIDATSQMWSFFGEHQLLRN
jgi:polyhydroxybutyrate depolymerase